MLYDKPLVFWSLKKCYCASPSLWAWLQLWWSPLSSFECLVNNSFQFPSCLLPVYSWTELAFNPRARCSFWLAGSSSPHLPILAALPSCSYLCPSSHFLLPSFPMFAACLFRCFLFLITPWCRSQVPMYTPPPSWKVLHVMPSHWLMRPLHLCDLALSAFLSLHAAFALI